jgi:hypothetical protein
MEIILFTATGIILYVLADRLLPHVERALGLSPAYRSLLFFAILLALALTVFSVLRQFGAN